MGLFSFLRFKAPPYVPPVETIHPDDLSRFQLDDFGRPMLPYPTWTSGAAREAAAYCLNCERNVNIIIPKTHSLGDIACPYCYTKRLVAR